MIRPGPYVWAALTTLVAPAAQACPDCYSGANGDPVVMLLLAAGVFLILRTTFRGLLRRWGDHSADRSEPPSEPEPRK